MRHRDVSRAEWLHWDILIIDKVLLSGVPSGMFQSKYIIFCSFEKS